MKKRLYLIICSALLFVNACSTEDLEPTLKQIKDIDTSITKVEDLEGILRGALNRLSQSNYYGRDFIILDEIRGDHVFANGNSGRFQIEGNFEYIPSTNDGIWTRAYAAIASTNIIINTDTANLEGDAAQATNIQGQALLIRALAHFDLLRQYGQQYAGGGSLGVPYIKEFKGEDLIPARNSVTEVVQNIYEDLGQAFSMMNSSISDNREFPSKWTAKALEGRLALYMKDWARAASASAEVLNSNAYSIIPAEQYAASFAQDNASNSIFELAYSDVDNVGINGLGYIYRGDNYGDIEVLPPVADLYEEGDVRADILGFEGQKLRNMGKYPELQGFDNISIIRIEEVLLNYAEALFEQGQTEEAITQLNLLTDKRNAAAYNGTISKDDILKERQKELIFEGFRFFDLSRAGRAIPIVHELQNIQTSIPAGDYRYALPIPIVEMDANSNMEQNDGY